MPLKMYQEAKPEPKESGISKIRSIIAVAAGKGGVGKSTVSVNLAFALLKKGFKVGLLDADLYGPSLRMMLPEDQPPESTSKGISPAMCNGIKLISMAHFKNSGNAAIVRAPVANQLIQQFIHDVDWGDLDYLIVDFPPGTGDIQLTLCQKMKFTAAIMVTTPQEVALLDVRKAIQMFEQMNVPVAGILENMSYYVLPNGDKAYPFGKGGGLKLSEMTEIPLLGQIPIEADISICGDNGRSIFSAELSNVSKEIFLRIAEKFEGIIQTAGQKSEKDQGIAIANFMQKGPSEFSIEWSDGKISHYQLANLQRNCPCAGCVDETNGERKKIEIPPNLRAKGIQNVGRYAIKIDYDSGCSKGIYTYALLRQLG